MIVRSTDAWCAPFPRRLPRGTLGRFAHRAATVCRQGSVEPATNRATLRRSEAWRHYSRNERSLVNFMDWYMNEVVPNS